MNKIIFAIGRKPAGSDDIKAESAFSDIICDTPQNQGQEFFESITLQAGLRLNYCILFRPCG